MDDTVSTTRRRGGTMKRRVPLFFMLVFLAAVVWIFPADAPNSIETTDVSTIRSTDAGLKIYIDPDTKKPIEAPISPDLAIPSMDDDLNHSSEGLIVEKSPISGEMVNLQGRFQHRYTASIDADGKHTVGCDLHKSTGKKSTDSGEE
jgi:hypothetical protein